MNETSGRMFNMTNLHRLVRLEGEKTDTMRYSAGVISVTNNAYKRKVSNSLLIGNNA